MKSLKTTSKFPFVTASRIRDELGLTKALQARIRKQYPSPLYWFKVPGGRSILWNYRLMRDGLLNGFETPAHRRLVEEFIAECQ